MVEVARSRIGLPALCLGLWLTTSLGALAYFRATFAVGERPIYYITGDEPHYLVIVTSLLRDGDLDVLNNYRDKHYLPFYPHHLGDPRDLNEMHALYGRGGAVYSKHPIGLPLLVLPAFRVAGAFGVNVVMMVLTGLLGIQVFLLARDLTGKVWPALAVWAAALFAAPLLLYADQVYPEVPGALLLIAAVRAILRQRPGRWEPLIIGVCAALLPWLHLRYAPTAAIVVGAWVLAGGWHRRRQWPLILAPTAASLAALLVYYDRLFGGIPAVSEFGVVSLGNMLMGAVGLLLDQQYGLLMYAPVYVFALWGLALLRGVRLPHLWVLALVIGTYYAFLSSFSWWFGAWSPPARMLVFITPLLAALMAVPLARWHSPIPWAIFAVLAGGGYWVAYQLMLVPALRYNLWDGSSRLLAHLSKQWRIELVSIFPSYIVPSPASVIWAVVLPLVLAVVGWVLHKAGQPVRHGVARPQPRAETATTLATATPAGRSGS